MITCLWWPLNCLQSSWRRICCRPQVGCISGLFSVITLYSSIMFSQILLALKQCRVRKRPCEVASSIFTQSLLCLYNVWLFVLKPIWEASGIIFVWSARPFHIVWHERAVWGSGRNHYPPFAEEKERNGSRTCEAEPEALLWLIPNIIAFTLIQI